jgi:hypothetical protein
MTSLLSGRKRSRSLVTSSATSKLLTSAAMLNCLSAGGSDVTSRAVTSLKGYGDYYRSLQCDGSKFKFATSARSADPLPMVAHPTGLKTCCEAGSSVQTTVVKCHNSRPSVQLLQQQSAAAADDNNSRSAAGKWVSVSAGGGSAGEVVPLLRPSSDRLLHCHTVR